MGVAHLGDRLVGGAAIRGDWPKDEPNSTRISARKCSSRLLALGHYPGDTDGKFGSKTREAVRNFQLKRGLVPDGYADVAAPA